MGLAIILVAVACATIYFYLKYLYSHWQRHGIPYLEPSFPFGNYSKFFMRKWRVLSLLSCIAVHRNHS